MKHFLSPAILLLTLVSPLLLPGQGTVKDIDGQSYQTTRIGEQEWTAENLHTSRFRNGEAIIEVRTIEDWWSAFNEGIPVWCYYDFNTDNGKKYGKIYNVHAVLDPRGLAPSGWRIPSKDDYTTLIRSVTAEAALRSTGEWSSGDGTNTTGFNALPSGYNDGESFFGLGMLCSFWTNTTTEFDEVYTYSLHSAYKFMYSSKWDWPAGAYVRCIKE